jgi:activator of HSP90 ATPase
MVLDQPYVGLVEYKADSKEIASVSYSIILPEREIESEEEERIPDTLIVTEELSVEEIVDRFGEILTEEQQTLLEQHAAQFPVTEEEAVAPEPVSNNHQIETNESTDIDWF